MQPRRPGRARSLAIALVASCLLLLASASSSLADSIVFLKDGDVWLTSPDGTKQYRVTTGGGWDSPSQADDGTIVAARGTQLVRMDRSGRVLGTPVAGVGGSTSTIAGATNKLFGPFDPQVSPDGRQIAYWATAYTVHADGGVNWNDFRDVVLVTPSDRNEPLGAEDYVTSVKTPSWVTGDRLLVSGSGLVNFSFQTWQPGRGSDWLQWWFRYVNAIEQDAELSPDGRKLVSVAQTNGALSAPDTLHFFAVPGPAWTEGPYPGTWEDDAVRPPAGEARCQNVRDSDAHSPSWSPRSDAVAYDDKDGVWVAQAPGDLSTCAAMSERLLVPGGSHPDWGPADVDLAQRPAGSGAAAGAAPPPAAPAPAPAVAPGRAAAGSGAAALRVTVAASARRRSGLAVGLTLARPATVRLTLCRLRGSRCRPKPVRRSIRADAGTSRVVLPTRRLRAGRYRLTVAVAGSAPVLRTVRLR